MAMIGWLGAWILMQCASAADTSSKTWAGVVSSRLVVTNRIVVHDILPLPEPPTLVVFDDDEGDDDLDEEEVLRFSEAPSPVFLAGIAVSPPRTAVVSTDVPFLRPPLLTLLQTLLI